MHVCLSTSLFYPVICISLYILCLLLYLSTFQVEFFLGVQVCSTSRGIGETVCTSHSCSDIKCGGNMVAWASVFSKSTAFLSRHAERAGTWGVRQVSDICLGTNCYCDTNISNGNVFTKHLPGLTRVAL